MPNIPLILFCPSLHFFHLIGGNHSGAVEHSCVFLQVIQHLYFFACSLPLRRNITVHVLCPRHIIKGSRFSMSGKLFCRRILWQRVGRIFYVENNRLIAYLSSSSSFSIVIPASPVFQNLTDMTVFLNIAPLEISFGSRSLRSIQEPMC